MVFASCKLIHTLFFITEFHIVILRTFRYLKFSHPFRCADKTLYAFVTCSIPWELYRHLFEHTNDKLTLTVRKVASFSKILTVLDAVLFNYYLIIAVYTDRFNIHSAHFPHRMCLYDVLHDFRHQK